MTTLRTVAASVARRLARVRPEIRAAEEALAAGDADRAIALTDSDIRSRPDDRDLLLVRRRAFAARGDQSGVAATLAALRRTRGGESIAETERRLQGDLAETDPRWRPRVRGPRRADRAPLGSGRPPPAEGVAAAAADRLHDEEPRQPARAAGGRVGSGRRDRPRLPTLDRWATVGRQPEEIDGIRHHRLDLGSGYPADGPVDAYLEDYAWRAAVVARAERPAIVHASSGGRGYESALVGLALGEHLDLPVVYEVRSLFDGPASGADRTRVRRDLDA